MITRAPIGLAFVAAALFGLNGVAAAKEHPKNPPAPPHVAAPKVPPPAQAFHPPTPRPAPRPALARRAPPPPPARGAALPPPPRPVPAQIAQNQGRRRFRRRRAESEALVSLGPRGRWTPSAGRGLLPRSPRRC